ncbi:hypothetical protein JOE49_003770 [Paenibacillus sp. PvR133]|nr:hypothetical protein [Paenibacillus sp. PvR133]
MSNMLRKFSLGRVVGTPESLQAVSEDETYQKY